MANRYKIFRQMVKAYGFLAVLMVWRNISYHFRRQVLKQKTAVCKINGRYIMRLDLDDEALGKELYINGFREELETEVVKTVIKPGMRILEPGANMGYYTLLMARLVGRAGRIYALEPFPENIKRLKHNIRLNNLGGRIEVEQLALSDENGWVNFYAGATHNLGTIMKLDKDQTNTPLKVKVASMADYVKDKLPIDFVRMDIERGELKIFKNMMHEWERQGYAYPKMIFFEIHPTGEIDPDPAFTKSLTWLTSVGYRPRYVVSSSYAKSIENFAKLGYKPIKIAPSQNALYENIKPEDLLTIAARRPRKWTRAILLEHAAPREQRS